MNDKTPTAYVMLLVIPIPKMYTFKTNADCTYIISSKENVHRNVEEIGELFPLKRLCTAKHCSPLNRTYKLQRIWYVAERETNILQRNLSLGVKMFAKR